jgi:hypothetical protein
MDFPMDTLHSFSSFEDASAAFQALEAAGVSRIHMQLIVREDDAGPAAGNFLVGNAEADENFRRPAYPGAYLLAIEGLEPGQLAAVQPVLERFGGVAVEQVAALGARAAAAPQPTDTSSRPR